MALTGWSTSNYLRRLAQVIDTYPFMISWWGYRVSDGGFAVSVGTNGSFNQARARTGLDTVTFQAFAEGRTTSSGFAFSTNAAPTNSWFHACSEHVAIEDRAISVDGADRVPNTTSRDPTASDSLHIGVAPDVSFPYPSSGALAEISLWDAAGLSEANRLALRDKLAAGENPKAITAESAQPWTGKLVAYWRLQDGTDLTDLSGNGHDLSMVGSLSTFGTHAPVDAVPNGSVGASMRKVLVRRALGSSGNGGNGNGEPAAETGLNFPGSAAVTDGETIRFKFANVHTNGLPIYGASGAGLTYIWRCFPVFQAGFYTAFFWANDDGGGTLDTFLWKSGDADTYYGCHPYPHFQDNNIHKWEISVQRSDIFVDAVTFDQWYVQALRVWGASGQAKQHEYYWDLPNTDSNHLVTYSSTSTYGDTNPPAPTLTWGDAPWQPGQEVWRGILRGFQIYNVLLSTSDILAEIDDPLSTTAGAAGIWYLNLNPTPDDISDQSGQGHHPSWVGALRPTLWTP